MKVKAGRGFRAGLLRAVPGAGSLNLGLLSVITCVFQSRQRRGGGELSARGECQRQRLIGHLGSSFYAGIVGKQALILLAQRRTSYSLW